MKYKKLSQYLRCVIIFALGLLGSVLGTTALASCSTSHNIDGSGKTTIVTTDTTYIYHSGVLKTK